MALRNAFAGLATETTLRRLLNNLNFARTGTDALRVNVDNTPQAIVYRGNTGTLTTADTMSFYNISSWNLVDAREPLRVQGRANTIAVRNGRWSIS
jgi:hypothetical protein